MSKITVRKTHDVTRTAVRIIKNSLVGPRSRELLSRSDEETISSAEINPADYGTDVLAFREDWLADNLLRKYPELDVSVDREQAALDKFWEAEEMCGETNLRLLGYSSDPDVEAVLHIAERKIESLLGAFDWDAAAELFGFSSGASTRLKRRDALSPLKFSSKGEAIHVTRSALPLAVAAVRSSPFWTEVCTKHRGDNPLNWFKVVPGNVLLTVPKNAKTNRTIAKEPCMNMYLQRGIGGLIRKRLKRVGIDLDSQIKNQELCRLGSLYDDLATVDLSAASDSVSVGIVQRLLPKDWFDAIMRTRSAWGTLPNGSLYCYRKVSSMGNGFTFELESLIFWALCSGVLSVSRCLDRRLAIYGDDIVIHRQAVPLLARVFSYCGFLFNEAKSFVSGPFRESCGKHYFLGVDVTPFYVRLPVNSVQRMFWLVNSYRRWASRAHGFAPGYYFKTWKKLVSLIPKRYRRLSVPEGFGDGGVMRDLADAKPKRAKTGFYIFPYLKPKGCVRLIPGYLGYLDTIQRRSAGEPFEAVTQLNRYGKARPSYIGGKRVPFECAVGVLESSPDLMTAAICRNTITEWTDPDPWIFVEDDRARYCFVGA